MTPHVSQNATPRGPVVIALIVIVSIAGPGSAPAASVLIASHLTDDVREYDLATGDLLRSIGSSDSLAGPAGLAISPLTGNLLVTSELSNSVEAFDLSSGSHLGTFASDGLSRPVEMLFTPSDTLLVASRFNDQILEYKVDDGTLLRVFASGGDLDGPTDLAVSPHTGNLLVSARHADAVLEYDLATGDYLGIFADGMSFPLGIAFGPDGNLYVANRDADAVLRYDGRAGTFLDSFASGPPMTEPHDLAFTPDGRLLVGTRIDRLVAAYDATTGTLLGSLNTDAELDYPFGLVVAGSTQDCNDNARPDWFDIVSGFSADVDGDTIPDEAETGLLTSFEDFAVGNSVLVTHSPGTNDNIVNNSQTVAVTDEQAYSGLQSLKVQWQFVDAEPFRWIRLNTQQIGASDPRLLNPAIDFNVAVRIRLLLLDGSFYRVR